MNCIVWFFTSMAEDATRIDAPAGQRTGDAVAAAGGNKDACVYLVNGKDVGKDYAMQAGDVVFARQLPRGAVTAALAITAAAVVVGIVGGAAVKAYAEKKIAKALKDATVTNKSTDTSYDEAPWLNGASNQVATGRTFPYIIGKTYFAPYKLCAAHMSFTDGTYPGANQFYNMVLECGFNYLTVKEISLKNTTIADWTDTTTPQGIGSTVSTTASDVATVYQVTLKVQTGYTSNGMVSVFETKTVTLPYGAVIQTTGGAAGQAWVIYSVNGVSYTESLVASSSFQGTVTVKEVAVDILSMQTGATYYDAENALEVRQDGDFADLTQFNIKKVWTDVGTEIPHDYGDSTDEGDEDSTWDSGITVECPSNTASVEAWVEFPTCRYYDDNGDWQSAVVDLEAAWSNDGGETWCDFDYDLYGYIGKKTVTSTSTSTESIKKTFYEQSYRKSLTEDIVVSWLEKMYPNAYKIVLHGYSATAVNTQKINSVVHYLWQVTCSFAALYYVSSTSTVPANRITSNASSVQRYCFTQKLTYANAYGKSISVRIRRTSAKYENDQSSVYFLGVNTQHYDDIDDIEDLVEDNDLLTEQLAAPLESRLANKCTRLGIVMKSTDNTTGNLDYFNVIVQGIARVWDSDEAAWTSTKQETSNLAAWVLEILTTDHHTPSKYEDSEIDLDSFGAWYEYCDAMGFEANGAITDDAKKSEILETLLSNGHASLYVDEFTGKLAIAYDGYATDEDLEASYNIAILNSDNIISIESTREYSRKADGLRVSYVDAAANYETNTFILMGETDDDGYPREYDPESDTLEDLSLSYVTSYEHAYKLAWRKLAEQKAAPRTVMVTVSAEGAYYPLYSRVLLQHKALATGLGYGRIVGVTYSANTGLLTSITLATPATALNTTTTYGVIINCQSGNHRGVLSFTVKRGVRDARSLYINSGSIYADDELAPEVGDAVSYGTLDSDGGFTLISSPMKVTNITPSGTGYQLTLQDFNEDVYKYATMPTYRSNVTASGNSVSAAAAVEIAKAAASASQTIQTAVSTLQNTSASTDTVAAASEMTADEVAGMVTRGNHYTEIACLSSTMETQLEVENLARMQRAIDKVWRDVMDAISVLKDKVIALEVGYKAFEKLSCSGGVTLSGLPTEEPSKVGQLWNDSGTLKIATGN